MGRQSSLALLDPPRYTPSIEELVAIVLKANLPTAAREQLRPWSSQPSRKSEHLLVVKRDPDVPALNMDVMHQMAEKLAQYLFENPEQRFEWLIRDSSTSFDSSLSITLRRQ